MDSGTTYDVRFHKTHVYKGSRVITYYVRWTVAGQPRKQPFRFLRNVDPALYVPVTRH